MKKFSIFFALVGAGTAMAPSGSTPYPPRARYACARACERANVAASAETRPGLAHVSSRRALIQSGAALCAGAALPLAPRTAWAADDNAAWLPLGLYTGAPSTRLHTALRRARSGRLSERV